MTIQLLPNPIYIDVLCSQGEKDIRHGEFKIKKTERSGWGSKNESKIVFFDVRKEPILFFARMKIVIVVISNFCENVVISNANFGFSLRPISIRKHLHDRGIILKVELRDVCFVFHALHYATIVCYISTPWKERMKTRPSVGSVAD